MFLLSNASAEDDFLHIQTGTLHAFLFFFTTFVSCKVGSKEFQLFKITCIPRAFPQPSKMNRFLWNYFKVPSNL